MRHGKGAPSVRLLGLVTLSLLVTVASWEPRAHKAITSKYTYHEHVFPIVRDRCGRCHVEGGPTPMSLMTYKAAVPWAESIREQLIGQAMPPWYVDPLATAVKGGHTITPKELDILITWAVGGTPEGDDSKAAPPATRRAEWRAGTPDATFAMPSPHVVPAGTLDSVHELVIPTTFDQEKWITAVDVLPGTPSMVQAATIAFGDGQIVLPWVAGDDVIPVPNGTGYRLAPGEKLRVRIRYRKHWQDEMEERSDRSTLGVYFGEPPVSGRAIHELTLESAGGDANSTAVALAGPTKTPARILAVTPTVDQPYATLAVDAVLPAGRRVGLLRLQAPRPGWTRRYWLADPVELPANSRIEVTVVPPESVQPGQTSGRGQPLRVALDFVPL